MYILGRNHINVICVTSHFHRVVLLKKHQLIHSREKSYQCIHCEMSFSVNSQLIFHMKTHTGEKTYRCSQCDKGFLQKGDLKNTWGHTLERNHIHASIVKRILHIEEILEFIWEYILVRSHISVSCAPCPLNIIALLYLINWDTVGRNHISADNVTRNSLLKVYL